MPHKCFRPIGNNQDGYSDYWVSGIMETFEPWFFLQFALTQATQQFSICMHTELKWYSMLYDKSDATVIYLPFTRILALT